MNANRNEIISSSCMFVWQPPLNGASQLFSVNHGEINERNVPCCPVA